MMKRVAMTTVLTLSIVSLAALLIVGDAACNKAPTMTWAEACLKACNTPALYNLCQETLQQAPDAAEATVYAAAAAKRARDSYDTTLAQAERLLGGGGGGSLPGDEQTAYWHCIKNYAVASSRMAGVVDDMSSCEFEHTIAEYVQSVAAMENCVDALSNFHRARRLSP